MPRIKGTPLKKEAIDPMQRNSWIGILSSILVLGVPQSILAHPGGLDSQGGHYNRKTGEYHYHRTTSESPPTKPQERLFVVRVIDGDTIKLSNGEKVRLIGVDTPETVHPSKPVEYFGREASKFTKQLCEGKTVRLEYDWQKTDKYGRTLAYIYLTDGRLVNAEIIKEGYGFAYTKFPFKYLEEFRQYEREAREKGKGLWAEEESTELPED